ncbi:MAG: gamma-glutamyl-gamma-aminobutyrate hydrolase family protein [Ilumatobacteraceae bacterium]
MTAAGTRLDPDPSRRPLIGLSGRRKVGAEVAGFPASMAAIDVDVYVSDYARSITAAGGLPVHLPQHVDPVEYTGRLDGLLLSGGTDIDPARYGATAETDQYPPEPERDAAELGLLAVAVAADLPVLGICRGLQLLNVWAGGTLHQHVAGHARYDVPPSHGVDEVTMVPGTLMEALYGASRAVNSLHHQVVDEVAPGWVVTARGADGLVEALEWPGHDIVGVQWHPELLPHAGTDPLFAWLVDRARDRAVAGD